MTLGRRLLFALLAGVFLAVAFPPWNLPQLLPLGLILLAPALIGATGREAFYVGVLTGALYLGGTQFWLTSVFGMAAVSLIALVAAFTVLFCCLLPWLARIFPKIPLPLLAALLWVGIEHYRAQWFVLNFGWGSLGYAIAGKPAFAFFASLFGVHGISFALVALGFACRTELKRSAALTVIWAALCFYNPAPPAPERPLKVRLLQSMSDESYFLPRTIEAKSVGADIVVWPEYAVMEDPTNRLWPKIQEAVKQSDALLLLGGKDYQGRRNDEIFKNTAYLIDTNGAIIGKHVKNHTVHLINDGIKGTEAKALNSPLGKLGVAICFDMDYSDVARRLAADGAEVFLVPNMDPGEWGPVQQMGHRLLFAMRAMENNRWLARADVAGGTSVNAPTGQVTAHVTTDGDAMLDATIGRNTHKTLFTQGGWLLGPICTWLSVLGALYAGIQGANRSIQAKRGSCLGS
ncbi:MAG: nitrilase-related carbon-nitrogen hydrolase [Armatimonas sp.]